MLEGAQYSSNCFVTLTYRSENLKSSSGLLLEGQPSELASLHPLDLRNFLKRLRDAIKPLRIRFYAVGEYGDETWRPHYHVALFNFETCARGRTYRRPGSGRPQWEQCCVQCNLVGKTWGHGDVDLGILETSSAQYLAGYVTKKMTSVDDGRLFGRYPEFARMSLRPGIGYSAMHDVASQLMVFNLENSQGDVPSSLRHGSRLFPLGRYLRKSLRKMVGADAKTPEAVQLARAEELRPVREVAFNASRSFKEVLVEASKGEIASVVARHKLRKGRRSL